VGNVVGGSDGHCMMPTQKCCGKIVRNMSIQVLHQHDEVIWYELPRWNGCPGGGLIELEVSSLGGSDYATTNGVRREQDGCHLIYFKGRFYRPVEPGDLKK